jgi:lipopolysaccharide transport system permease protein
VTPLRIPGRYFVQNLVTGRALVAQLVRRDFQQRYVGSVAGWLWGVVHPLVQLGIWYYIFVKCLDQRMPPGAVTSSYLMFLFCGFLPWMLFQETVTRSANCMVENANLITKTVFPSEVLPVSVFLSSLIHHLIGLALAVAAVLLIEKHMSAKVLLLPVYMVFVGMLGVGVGWIVSSLQVYLRDTVQFLTVVMTVWFWMTPIMILEDKIPAKVRPLIAWNPLTRIVRAYRERLLSPVWPHWQDLAILTACSAGIFILGGLFFRHLKRGFADVL